MTTTFITIIGDQPAPNIFLIKDRAFQDIDHYIFITTTLMESRNRLEHLLAALAIPRDCYEVLTISPNNLSAIRASLNALDLEKRTGNYHINITSGSKMMAIGVFNYFMTESLVTRSKFYYISIRDRHFLQIFPEQEYRAIKLSHQIGLTEYLRSYGISINGNTKLFEPKYPKEIADVFFKHYLDESNFTGLDKPLQYIASDLRNHFKKCENQQRNKGPVLIKVEDDPNWKELIVQTGFPIREEGLLDKEDVQYLTGTWFEEWVYFQIRDYLRLNGAIIGCSIQLQRSGLESNLGKNEFDLLFIFKNELYVIECKSGLAKGYPAAKRMFDQAAHRLAALRSDFGLKVNTIFVTLSKDLRKNVTALKPAIENKALSLNIQVLDRQDFTDEPDIWIWKIIKP